MAQRAAAGLTLPLPDGLDEVTAAAIVNPGVGAWLALTRRAMLQPGETVLVLGATGVSGRIAVVLAARVRRLVLVATGPGALMVPGHPRVLLRMLTPRRHRDPGHAARIAGELYGGSVRDDPALARDLLHATTTRLGPSTGYYYQLLSSIAWTSLPRLPRRRPPTLILAGDDDPIIPLINARIMHG